MSTTMVQIGNVPADLHRQLKVRAPGPAPGWSRSPPRAFRRQRDPGGARRPVIVLDASVLVELLLGTRCSRAIAVRVADPALGLNAPHLADAEVTQALRRFVRDGELDAAAGAAKCSPKAKLTHDNLRFGLA